MARKKQEEETSREGFGSIWGTRIVFFMGKG
jgi:hypothetical protein